MKAHHAVAGLPLGDPAAGRDNGAGQLVAKDLRRLDVAMEDLLDVGAANAAGGDFDEHFAVANFRDRNLFKADDAFFAENTRAHGFGDRTKSVRRFGNSTGRAHTAGAFFRTANMATTN